MTENIITQYKRIISECFWDLNFTVKDIERIVSDKNIKESKLLFSKILINSRDVLNDLKIFDMKELSQLIEEFIVPSFNHDYIFRRKNIAEVYFLNKPLLIDELKWIV